MTKKEMDNYIIEHDGCVGITCNECVYHSNNVLFYCKITEEFGTRPNPHEIYRITYNKLKFERMKEILK